MKLSIELSESQLQKLREEAGRNDVRAAVDRVLRKNEELYRRLS